MDISKLKFVSGFNESGQRYGQTRKDYYAELESKGMVVVTPKPNQIFIDIDTEEQYNRYNVMFGIVSKNIASVFKVYDEPSPSNKPFHRHIIIELPFDVSEMERLVYQAVLGSDSIKEFLSLLRIYAGELPATLLAEKK